MLRYTQCHGKVDIDARFDLFITQNVMHVIFGTIWDDMGQTHLLRIAEVKARTTLSKSEIYRRIEAGTFPRQLRFSARVVAWRESDIERWITGQWTGDLDHMLVELIA